MTSGSTDFFGISSSQPQILISASDPKRPPREIHCRRSILTPERTVLESKKKLKGKEVTHDKNSKKSSDEPKNKVNATKPEPKTAIPEFVDMAEPKLAKLPVNLHKATKSIIKINDKFLTKSSTSINGFISKSPEEIEKKQIKKALQFTKDSLELLNNVLDDLAILKSTDGEQEYEEKLKNGATDLTMRLVTEDNLAYFIATSLEGVCKELPSIIKRLNKKHFELENKKSPLLSHFDPQAKTLILTINTIHKKIADLDQVLKDSLGYTNAAFVRNANAPLKRILSDYVAMWIPSKKQTSHQSSTTEETLSKLAATKSPPQKRMIITKESLNGSMFTLPKSASTSSHLTSVITPSLNYERIAEPSPDEVMGAKEHVGALPSPLKELTPRVDPLKVNKSLKSAFLSPTAKNKEKEKHVTFELETTPREDEISNSKVQITTKPLTLCQSSASVDAPLSPEENDSDSEGSESGSFIIHSSSEEELDRYGTKPIGISPTYVRFTTTPPSLDSDSDHEPSSSVPLMLSGSNIFEDDSNVYGESGYGSSIMSSRSQDMKPNCATNNLSPNEERTIDSFFKEMERNNPGFIKQVKPQQQNDAMQALDELMEELNSGNLEVNPTVELPVTTVPKSASTEVSHVTRQCSHSSWPLALKIGAIAAGILFYYLYREE